MKLFLREAAAKERRRGAFYIGLTNTAVWGEPKDLKKEIEALNRPPT